MKIPSTSSISDPEPTLLRMDWRLTPRDEVPGAFWSKDSDDFVRRRDALVAFDDLDFVARLPAESAW